MANKFVLKTWPSLRKVIFITNAQKINLLSTEITIYFVIYSTASDFSEMVYSRVGLLRSKTSSTKKIYNMKQVSLFMIFFLMVSVKIFAQAETDAKPLLALFQQVNLSIERSQSSLSRTDRDEQLRKVQLLLQKENLEGEEISELSTLLGFSDTTDFRVFVSAFNNEAASFKNSFSQSPIDLEHIMNQIGGSQNDQARQTYSQCRNNALATAVVCIGVSVACGPFLWLCGGGCIANEIISLNSCNQQFYP